MLRQRLRCRLLPLQVRLGQRRLFHLDVDLVEDLSRRGLTSNITKPDQLEEHVKGCQSVYAGVDPTAEYLHVGHLLPLFCLLHFQIRGHRTIPLIGGATGLVGDPSGRRTERPAAKQAQIEHNVGRLTAAVTKFFGGAISYANARLQPSELSLHEPVVCNNRSWFQDLGLLAFLQTVGSHARVNTMLARESVQARLKSNEGISFTEFTYQLMQAYDFYVLNKNMGCTIQIGGSDQWGNIVAGIDLINRASADSKGAHSEDPRDHVYGITTPLLTAASGEKYGKSAGNAVALDEKITSIFDFYQFFLRTPDADVSKLLKMFTLLSMDKINAVLAEHSRSPEKRIAQRLLADEITMVVHGEDGVRRAKLITKVVYQRDIHNANADEVIDVLRDDPILHYCEFTEVSEIPAAKLAVILKLSPSNSAVRQLVTGKGLYINDKPVTALNQKLASADFIDGRFVVLSAGSQNKKVLALRSRLTSILVP